MVEIGFLIGILAILFYTPYKMARGISKLASMDYGANTLLCMIPLVNIIRAEKQYFGKISIVTISTIAAVVSFGLRLITLFFMIDNVPICTASVGLMIAAFLFMIFANMRFVFIVINDADAMSGFKLWLFTLLYPFGQWYIGTYICTVIANKQRFVETFADDNEA